MLQTILDAITTHATPHKRLMVAIAGPPGAGKSTLAGELVHHLPPGTAMVLPMDGLHYDNAVLNQLGLRHCKGSPETFDYAGLAVLLQRLRAREPNVAIPIFDRTIDLARAAGAIIDLNVSIVIAEGNYLLLDEAPWNGLKEFFDLTVFIEVPRPELYRRLIQRWLDLGYSQSKAERWVTTNDMPNVDRVQASVLAHHFCINSAK